MTMSQPQLLGLVASAVIVVGSGLWLTRAGRPYGAGTLAVHKLVTVAAVVSIVVMLRRVHQVASLSPSEWLAVGVAAALVLATTAAGGVVTATARAPMWVVWCHRISSWVALAVTILCLVSVGRS